jgi:hypothetical protein
MTYLISIVFVLIVPSLIQCQSGTFTPMVGLITSLDQVSYYRMITELGCVTTCIGYTSPSCYAISYESFGQECRIITEPIPSGYTPDQLLHNWRSYIRINDY